MVQCLDECRETALLLLGSGGGIHWAVRVDVGRRGHGSLGVDTVFGSRGGVAAVAARRNVDLHQWRLRCAVVWHITEWAAAWQLADGRLSPTLALNRDAGSGAEILLKLIGIRCLVSGRASIWKTALPPGLGGILVLGGTELASCLRLLLQ